MAHSGPRTPVKSKSSWKTSFPPNTTHRIPHVIPSSSKSGTPNHSIICREQVPSVERRYGVDETHEWIVYSSKKVCWIPPGCIELMEGIVGLGTRLSWLGGTENWAS